ncbi:hypothetical protein QRX50_35340 [Amycolatopsis carbonis]|uniref:Uncharacterized protein n=1 Tax=Amycolatopsis carbonis TaxID=715471 RepID=A0A9Y2MVG0_9PSEU|nr:hypothetical protein [Amycolatopsis sp. 2-15]WIX76692.1 hypothetical protein QRX50_35340 [Amycolatopsis sp. 2-15]
MCSASDPDDPAPALRLHQPARPLEVSALRHALTDWARARGLPAS